VVVGKRLVLAIEEDVRVDIMHACGSYAECTTCRVESFERKPEAMPEAEIMIHEMRKLLGRPGTRARSTSTMLSR